MARRRRSRPSPPPLPFDFTALLAAAPGERLPLPAPSPSLLVVVRVRYRVRCHRLDAGRYDWVAGLPGMDAAAAAERPPDPCLAAWRPQATALGLDAAARPVIGREAWAMRAGVFALA